MVGRQAATADGNSTGDHAGEGASNAMSVDILHINKATIHLAPEDI